MCTYCCKYCDTVCFYCRDRHDACMEICFCLCVRLSFPLSPVGVSGDRILQPTRGLRLKGDPKVLLPQNPSLQEPLVDIRHQMTSESEWNVIAHLMFYLHFFFGELQKVKTVAAFFFSCLYQWVEFNSVTNIRNDPYWFPSGLRAKHHPARGIREILMNNLLHVNFYLYNWLCWIIICCLILFWWPVVGVGYLSSSTHSVGARQFDCRMFYQHLKTSVKTKTWNILWKWWWFVDFPFVMFLFELPVTQIKPGGCSIDKKCVCVCVLWLTAAVVRHLKLLWLGFNVWI